MIECSKYCDCHTLSPEVGWCLECADVHISAMDAEIRRLKTENDQLREYAKEKAVPTTYVQMQRCTCKDASHGVVGCASPCAHYTDSTLCAGCVMVHSRR